jgi:hypothetical protein
MRAVAFAIAAALAAAPAAGCLRSSTFTCETDPECSGGTCEADHYCSFNDSTCPSGRRYGDQSGPVANECVGGNPDIDGPPGQPDGPPGQPDAPMIDAGPGDCPGDYVTVGSQSHVYKVLGGTESWTNRQVTCANAGAYLAIPADSTELSDVIGFAGGGPIWVGISDSVTETVFVDVRGGTTPYLPWASGQPDDNNPGEDCVKATGATYSDERCSQHNTAVCECEP